MYNYAHMKDEGFTGCEQAEVMFRTGRFGDDGDPDMGKDARFVLASKATRLQIGEGA